MIGLIDLAIEDARLAGLSAYADDLERMHAAADRLAAMISELLADQATALGARSAGGETASHKLRHDLKTPVSAIIGYAELVAEEARDSGDHVLLEPLADVLDAAGRLLGGIDRLVEYTDPDAPEFGDAAVGAAPAVLRQAMEVVRQLVDESAPGRSGATGRILIIDDNPSILDLLSRRLTREATRSQPATAASWHSGGRKERRSTSSSST